MNRCSAPAQNNHPIGIFDSGVGGLTVALALRRQAPAERLLYLGDIARLPYGTKDPATVVRYALQAGRFLVGQGVKMLVVACNTASAHALPALIAAFPHLPVVGVVEAGAAAAVAAGGRRVVVAATDGTCRSGAYGRAIADLDPSVRVDCVPCPLFVSLAEEGMTDGPIVEAMAERYLGERFTGPDAADCLVLGCTHFPLLAPVLARVAGPGARVVDCAEAAARRALLVLDQRGLAAGGGCLPGGLRLVSTDAPDRFARIAGQLFPGLESAGAVELVDLLPT